MNNYKEYIIRKLKKFKRENIIIDPHAEKRAWQRNIDLEEVKDNISNPRKLAFANRLEPEFDGLEKFKCYFAFSKT